MDIDTFLAELESAEQDTPESIDTTNAIPFDFFSTGVTGHVRVVPKRDPSRAVGEDGGEEGPEALLRDVTDLPIGLGPLPPGLDDPLEGLVERYLTPPRTLPGWFLDKAQRIIEREPDYGACFDWDVSPQAVEVVLGRDKRTGEVDLTSFEEVYHPPASTSSRTSTSLHRPPGDPSKYVRGSSTNVPFAFGGMETVALTEDDDGDELDTGKDPWVEGDLLEVPPGFPRGMTFGSGGSSKSAPMTLASIISEAGLYMFADLEEPAVETETDQKMPSGEKDVPHENGNGEAQATGKDDMDAIIPDLPLSLKSSIAITSTPTAPSSTSFARHVDITQPIPDFSRVVPVLAHSFPFKLDPFQLHAVYRLERGESVFVAAHTSAGKTVVAEYAVAMCLAHVTRCVYTSPIKALSNQKFREFRKTFGEENVGILTGDVQIRPEAGCLVMTTEILRSMLYRGADLVRDVEWVVFDECHYLNDAERGVVWEEVIIMLPAHVNIILLSATVPNAREFADWVGRTKGRPLYVISTFHRPVPLEHHLFVSSAGQAGTGEVFKIVNSQKQFLTASHSAAREAASGAQKEKEKRERIAAEQAMAAAARGRGGPQRGAGPNARGGRGAGRGGAPSFSAPVRYGASRPGELTSERAKTVLPQLITHLRKKDLLPCVVFTFSKKKCDDFAEGLGRMDLSGGAQEKSEVHVFWERSVGRLKGTDRNLPQLLRIRDLLLRGIAVHHGGLLPIVKEVVEILFSRGLVKVLFATETFAMGVNMPARTVVFSGLRKPDGKNFRELLPGEYTQMSGRAGRRGLDQTGTVIIVCAGDEVPDSATLSKMILGTPTKLVSQFRLTYTMILNLLRVESLKVEEMIRRSFSENATQRSLPEQQREYEAALKATRSNAADVGVDCAICEPDLEQYFDLGKRLLESGLAVMDWVGRSPVGLKSLAAGRVVLVNNAFYRNTLAVVLRVVTQKGAPTTSSGKEVTVLALLDHSASDAYKTERPPMPVASLSLPKESAIAGSLLTIGLLDIAIVTAATISVDADAVMSVRPKDAQEEYDAIARQLWRKGREISDMQAGIPEYDFSKIRDLDFQEKYRDRASVLTKITNSTFQCTRCPDLVDHYGRLHQRRALKDQLVRLAHTISDQNLELLPDYQQRVEVLKKMGCLAGENEVGQGGTVVLKGRVACEVSGEIKDRHQLWHSTCKFVFSNQINTADELIMTELIFDNFFADFEPAEIVALLSVFVFQEKSDVVPNLNPKMEAAVKHVVEVATKVAEIQRSCGLDIAVDEFLRDKLKFGLVEAVYEWAKGTSFMGITELTDVAEGSIVRCIVRLDETCREVRGAARAIGDTSLYKKMEEAAQMIKRDIVFAGMCCLFQSVHLLTVAKHPREFQHHCTSRLL
ncbi:antiviral helicase [Gonapodya prolifera JEL478]|uniref:Antiviral helicase n=1 Tax=Gonapodya prolifera (strain JEL478) TaxID=1344416 RepID=A0A139AF97_GONPJ|nr:antiviral helicase [Gonapodya prolifera JEL478]|eukprot:KXS15244.1 antiviral helicase [Gonapodya prolifera JEL478]